MLKRYRERTGLSPELFELGPDKVESGARCRNQVVPGVGVVGMGQLGDKCIKGRAY